MAHILKESLPEYIMSLERENAQLREGQTAFRNLMAQLIVRDAEHPGNVRLPDQRISASAFDAALAAALSTAQDKHG